MAVFISETALKEIDAYRDSLISYVSRKRTIEKYNRLMTDINSLDKSPQIYKICEYKTLGQEFKNGAPLHINLRRVNWKDGTKTQFAISYLFSERDGQYDVIVTHFVNAGLVKESNERDRLKSIIREELVKAINEGGYSIWK